MSPIRKRIWIIITLIRLISSLNLVPDVNNPIILQKPSGTSQGALVIKFSFPAGNSNKLGPEANGSLGLSYRQYLAVVLPTDTYDFKKDAPLECSLSTGEAESKVELEMVVDQPKEESEEMSTAYCRLDERDQTKLPLPENNNIGENHVYTFTIKFGKYPGGGSFINQISICTTTTNSADKLIIDSLPTFGMLAVYSDKTPSGPGSSAVFNLDEFQTNPSSVKPGDSFSLTIKVSIGDYLTINDNLIYFLVDSTYFSGFSSATITSRSALNNGKDYNKALTGTLGLEPLNSGFVLTGLEENLYKGRNFKITFSGLTALKSGSTTVQALVYYKNTYTVSSDSSIVLPISSGVINGSAHHPEFWDVYSNGAWPIQFNFSVENMLTTAGYVRIQHEYSDNTVLSFVSSTCDFSSTTGVLDSTFGTRPNCYPLENTTVKENDKGSGIFFRLKSISSGVNYKLTVWAFFDVCGSSYDSALNGGADSASSPSFSISIYSSITSSETGFNRFLDTNKIAEGVIDFSQKCHQTLMIKEGSARDNLIFNGGEINGGGERVKVYKEIFNWGIYSQTDYKGNDRDQNNFFKALNSNIPSEEKFLFPSGGTNCITSGSYFLVAFGISGGGSANLMKLIPTAFSTTTDPNTQPGKLVYQFSSKWFVMGDGVSSQSPGNCYASWGAGSIQEPLIVGDKDDLNENFGIFPNKFSASDKVVYSTNTNRNYFGVFQGGTLIDETNTNLPTDSSSPSSVSNSSEIIQLVSKTTDSSSANPRWSYMMHNSPLMPGVTNVNFVFFTTCVKWTQTPPQITSLYTYIDVQIKYIYMDSSEDLSPSEGAHVGVLRMIKLFPESGVFQDSSLITAYGTADNPFLNHVAYTSSATEAICLIQLKSSTFKGINSTGSSNSLAIWLFGGMLLETDYSDPSATYPAAPLDTGISSYGLTSNFAMDTRNFYLKLGDSNSGNRPLINIFSQLNSSKSLSNSTPLQNNNRSAYLFFMGSLLIFTGVSSTSNLTSDSSILIPYYCPSKFDWMVSDPIGLKGAPFTPTFTASWLSMGAHSSITSLDKIVSYQETASDNTINKYVIMGNRYSGSDKDLFKMPFSSSASINKSTLKFDPYTITSSPSLYVLNGVNKDPKVLQAKISCTGLSLFLSSTLSYTSGGKLSLDTNTNTPNVFDSSGKIFYAMGKAFSKAILFGKESSPVSLKGVNISSLSPSKTSCVTTKKVYKPPHNTPETITEIQCFYYTNISRPSMKDFIQNNSFILSDKIAFSCTSYEKSKNAVLTNFITEGNAKKFILDWYSVNSGVWKAKSSWDLSEEQYRYDPGTNINLVVTSNIQIPQQAQIRLNSSTFTVNTMCGVKKSSGLVIDCTQDNSGSTCSLPEDSSSFEFCCYNLNGSGTISFKDFKLFITPESSISDYVTQAIFNPSSFSGFNLAISQSSLPIMATSSAKITTISKVVYSHVAQTSGLGKITFTISFPRRATRNMKISILGDLSGLGVTGETPRCQASFGQLTSTPSSEKEANFSVEEQNSFIESCSTSDLATGLIVTTKKMIYKCGHYFSNSMTVSLWPVTVVNWSDSTNTKSFVVKMQVNGETNGNLAYNSYTAEDLNLPTSLNTAPLTSFQADTLCPVTVSPQIPGELADYTFTFDLVTSASKIGEVKPNEITIFWPYQYYGATLPGITCTGIGVDGCLFSDEGILNIIYTTPLPLRQKPSVTIIGIRNPIINSAYSFACSVNVVDYSTGTRTNVLTGSGLLPDGIPVPTTSESGSLRFLSVTTPVASTIVNEITSYTFRVTFDYAGKLTKVPDSISGTPVMWITFPTNYKFTDIDLSTQAPVASIVEYFSSNLPDTPNVESSTLQSASVSVISTAVSGNRIIITFSEETKSFGNSWKYMDITITNIPNPREEGKAGSFSATLTNNNVGVLYQTYTNTNTYIAEEIDSTDDPFLKWNKGIYFSVERTKWLLDIFGPDGEKNDKTVNVIKIKAGRYSLAYFKIRKLTYPNGPPADEVIYMSLPHDSFKTTESSYEVTTFRPDPVMFWIGCACNTVPGEYVVNFTYTGAVNFFPSTPIIINIENAIKGAIQIVNPTPTVTLAGSAWLGVGLENPNFESLTVNWKGDPSNDEGAAISSITFPPFSEEIRYAELEMLSSATTNQVFIGVDDLDNACFSFGANGKISIAVSGAVEAFPDDLVLPDLFSFLNADTSESNLMKNEISFKFTPPMTPLYIYCVLICSNGVFPADYEIKAASGEQSPLLRYFKAYVSTPDPIYLKYSNLIRGEDYKMKCIITTSEGDEYTRSSQFIELSSIKTDKVKVSSFSPVKAEPPHCLKFSLNSSLSSNSKHKLIEKCQSVFSAPGWSINGCVICTDSEMSHNSSTVTFPAVTSCTPKNFAAKTLRNLQSSNSFSICAIPTVLCASDASYNNKSFIDYFNEFQELVDSDDEIESITGESVQFVSVTSLSGEAPEATSLKGTLKSWNSDGSLTFNLDYTSVSSTPLKCYWAISENPFTTFKGVVLCSDISWCGSTNLQVSQQAEITTTEKRAFSAEKTYTVYVTCAVDIPLTSEFSSIIEVGSFTVPKPVDLFAHCQVWDFRCFNSSGIIKFDFYYLLILLLFFL